MNYGLYLSATGTLTNLYRQDVIANNLANANTVGFKPDSIALTSRLPERLENGGAGSDQQWMLEQLGGGTLVYPTITQFKQGSLVDSMNETDVALSGDGFFVLRDPRAGGAAGIRFTRDGRFTLNDRGDLISATSGLAVLDVNDRPIRLDRDADLRIDTDGSIRQDDSVVAQLQVANVPNTMTLEKVGENLLRFKAGTYAQRTPSDALVKQRFLEQSSVDPVLALKEMMDVSRAIGANTSMMQYQDRTLEQLIGTVARVA
jgi:flagellar basal body rod protein FlgG